MDPNKITPDIIEVARGLANTYAETQLWGVIAFFSVLVVVQFTTMVFLILKKDKAYVKLIETNAEADQLINQTFEVRHQEYVDVLTRSIDAINKNSAALTKLSDKMVVTDTKISEVSKNTLSELEVIKGALTNVEQNLESDNA